MKKAIFSIALTVAIAAAGVANAQEATPGINHREGRQQARIKQGVNSGQLTPGETGRLETREARIQQQKKMYKAQGSVTPAERAKLTREQNRTSKAIYNDKHNTKVE